jgi:hypothetical protein
LRLLCAQIEHHADELHAAILWPVLPQFTQQSDLPTVDGQHCCVWLLAMHRKQRAGLLFSRSTLMEDQKIWILPAFDALIAALAGA